MTHIHGTTASEPTSALRSPLRAAAQFPVTARRCALHELAASRRGIGQRAAHVFLHLSNVESAALACAPDDALRACSLLREEGSAGPRRQRARAPRDARNTPVGGMGGPCEYTNVYRSRQWHDACACYSCSAVCACATASRGMRPASRETGSGVPTRYSRRV
jgi:hypothetical protein